jgi:hypothetical protein
LETFNATPSGISVSTFFNPGARLIRMNQKIFAEVWDYSRNKGIPIGVNVESVSNRKAEIDASIDLLQRLRQRMG